MKVFNVKDNPLLCKPEFFISYDQLKALIQKVTDNLVSITDETGEFLLHLDDGRTIDTKGWAGWEWTHGIGLYGIYRYYEQTNDTQARDIIDNWFSARLSEDLATKNINTVCPFLTLADRYE
jgi:unsaturated rhamnogalacturonyl hydrolase